MDARDDTGAWEPPEPPGAVRPAWLRPGTRPGEPYGQTYGPSPGRPYGPPPGRPYGPYGSPYGGPYGPYGSGPGPGKPGMPPWAKVVLIAGVGFYAISALAGLFDLLLLGR